jgi:ubiquinone/menaquinone biosynthesis C-methylase UbiE
VDLPATGRILDVGCGTGALLLHISRIRPDALLAGADLSHAMLLVARARLGSRGLLAEADTVALPFRAGAFHLVVSASALHHWPEPAAAIPEMRRVLAPGGRLAITDWCADRWLDRIRDRIYRRLEPAHQRALRSAELASLLSDAGFSDVRVERWRIGFRWGMMTGVGTIPSAGP